MLHDASVYDFKEVCPLLILLAALLYYIDGYAADSALARPRAY